MTSPSTRRAAAILATCLLGAAAAPQVAADTVCPLQAAGHAATATCARGPVAGESVAPIGHLGAVDAATLKQQAGSAVLMIDVREAHAAIEGGTAPAVDALVPLLLRRSGALDEGDVNSAFVETVRMLGCARVGDRASTVALPSADGDLAEAAAARLQAPGLRRLWVVEGGIDGGCSKSGALEGGWKAARLPLVARPDARQLLAR